MYTNIYCVIISFVKIGSLKSMLHEGHKSISIFTPHSFAYFGYVWFNRHVRISVHLFGIS